ncbi:hypothetical protein QJ48_01580 [Paenibacillus sp. A3]|uniref:vWA domain-containing protein n=1 Tax=Paenibacillus sp. A3 TaxID=1337054 RepID=UPI0006D5825F|nr:vWA domain-containing protein [Paenibacillus sp. A3]KPV61136.1 hypothetical protein QJ48_01580 [Paenibacillus sp. A3]
MKRRKWNPLLTGLSIVGGFLGFIAGEMMLSRWEGTLHETVLMGLYFGVFALIVGLCCLLAEILSPQLNGKNWRLRYASDGWKLLVPGTLLLLFAAGALFQWAYGLYFDSAKSGRPQDYVLILDTSESMKQNDPNKQSLQAVKSLVGQMDSNKMVGVLTFNDSVTWVQRLTQLSSETAKSQVLAQIDAIPAPTGGTDIAQALTQAIDHMQKESQRKGAVILISDGYSDVDVDRVVQPYNLENITIHTIGMKQPNEEGSRLLQRIAEATGGTFQEVKQAELVTDAFRNIYVKDHHFHLVNERQGQMHGSGWHAALRVVLILLIGALLGLSLGIVFDNRFLARSFALGGTVAGLLAGLTLEYGLPSEYSSAVRAMADLILAVVLSLSTLLFAVHESTGANAGLRRGRPRELYAGPDGESSRYGGRDGSRTGKRFR